MPEATAHIVQRELKFSDDELVKLQAALDAGRPVKMNLGLHSKIWAITSGGETMALAKTDTEPEDDEEIVNTDLQPPDDGTNIPPDSDPTPPPEDSAKSAMAIAPTPGKRLIGATVKVYAVAVFQPKFSNG